jgi:Protein of unknown function (DUF3570)
MQLMPCPKSNPPTKGSAAKLILAAAFALPGIVPAVASAEAAPEHGEIGFKYLNYKDKQPGLDRINVTAPSVYAVIPIAGKWAVEGSVTLDAVSGASPRWHSSISSASKMYDNRTGADIKGTRYFDRSTVSLGFAYSREHDYLSRSYSLAGTTSSANNNTTWAYGLGIARDTINSVKQGIDHKKKNTTDLMIGVTQVLTTKDIVQANATVSKGKGFYNDIYKFPDNRPNFRDQYAIKTSWNHHFSDVNGTSRLSYRFYKDSFKVNAHTMTAEWVQNLGSGWQVTPSVRIHSQSAAYFYYDPIYDAAQGEPIPPGYKEDSIASADHRLSAFGGRTFGIKVSKAFQGGWLADARYDVYSQRASYRFNGVGSPGLAPFSARFIQFGLTKQL